MISFEDMDNLAGKMRDIMKHIYIYIHICDLDIFALGDYAMYIYIYVIYWIILDILE